MQIKIPSNISPNDLDICCVVYYYLLYREYIKGQQAISEMVHNGLVYCLSTKTEKMVNCESNAFVDKQQKC